MTYHGKVLAGFCLSWVLSSFSLINAEIISQNRRWISLHKSFPVHNLLSFLYFIQLCVTFVIKPPSLNNQRIVLSVLWLSRTNSLLEKVCNEVGRSHFYGCLWECLASNRGIRLPAISFVLSHFNKKLCMEDQLYVMGTNIDVMVRERCCDC